MLSQMHVEQLHFLLVFAGTVDPAQQLEGHILSRKGPPWATRPGAQTGTKKWWRRRESNPRPQALRYRLYMLIPYFDLVCGYPMGEENYKPV